MLLPLQMLVQISQSDVFLDSMVNSPPQRRLAKNDQRLTLLKLAEEVTIQKTAHVPLLSDGLDEVLK